MKKPAPHWRAGLAKGCDSFAFLRSDEAGKGWLPVGVRTRAGAGVFGWRVVPLVIVGCEWIPPPVTSEVSPDRVNVVGLVLRAVILNQKGGGLDAIVVRVFELRAARPRKE